MKLYDNNIYIEIEVSKSSDMEGEKMLMAAGVTAAVVTAAFVFWGPTGLL